MRHPIVEEDLRRILSASLPWEKLCGATILVTGAAGFLAAYMIETILAFNETSGKPPARVIGLIRNEALARKRFAMYGGRNDLSYLVQDVCWPLPVDLSIDYIIHAAGRASPATYLNDPVGTIAPNVIGTHQLLEHSVQAKCASVLFFSSSEVYGQPKTRATAIHEADFGGFDPTAPRSCYAESKRLGESLCVAWSRQFGVPAKIVRPFHTYGPGLRLDDGRVFADFVADILARRPITLRSDGSARRAFCYLSDAVAGFFTVLFLGEPRVGYNIGNPHGEASICQLADQLVQEFSERKLSVQSESRRSDDAYLPSAVDRCVPNIDRATALGWSPTIPIAEGFRRTVQSFE